MSPSSLKSAYSSREQARRGALFAQRRSADEGRGLLAYLRRNRVNPFLIHYSPSWIGLGLTATVLGLLGMRRYGRPVVMGAGAAGMLGLSYMTLVEPRWPILERITIKLPKLPPALDGLRIGQISDIHLGLPHTARNLVWAVTQMQHERPELLVITGDLTHHHGASPQLSAALRMLRAPLGIYAVPGNHDYWEGLNDVRAALQLLGIPMLMNEHRRICWNGGELWLVGIDDVWDGRPDLATAVHGIPADGFKVLLAHAPDLADQAVHYDIALQLSGHSHGGHLRLPRMGPITRPRYGARYVMGQYRIGTMMLYVTRGLGGTPLRLFCRPEATIVTLKRD